MVGSFGIALGFFLLLSAFGVFRMGLSWLDPNHLLLAKVGGVAALLLGFVELSLSEGFTALAARIAIGLLYLVIAWIVRYEMAQIGMMVAGILIAVRAVLLYFGFGV